MKIIAGDYRQLEVVIAAFVSRDPQLMSIVNAPADSPDSDLHAQTMVSVFNIPFGEQARHPGMRVTAKTHFFSKLYGAREWTVRERLEVAALEHPELEMTIPNVKEIGRQLRQVEKMYEGFFRTYVPLITTLARERGGVAHTAFGRPRIIPALMSNDKGERETAERETVSHTVQGTASDIVRKAMLGVNCLEHGRMIIQNHDEIVCEVDDQWVEWYMERMEAIMTLGQPLGGVELRVKVKSGDNWEECH